MNLIVSVAATIPGANEQTVGAKEHAKEHVDKINHNGGDGAGGAGAGRILAPLTDDRAADCGLDSLGFAVLVARLEDELGVDPFTAAEEAFFP